MRANACADCGHPTLREKCVRCEWRERQAWINHEKEERRREQEAARRAREQAPGALYDGARAEAATEGAAAPAPTDA